MAGTMFQCSSSIQLNLPTRHLTAAGIKANAPTDILIGDLAWARSVNATTSGVAGGADYSTGDMLALAQAEAASNGYIQFGNRHWWLQ